MPYFKTGSPPQLSQLIQARRLRFFGHVARMDSSLDITIALKVSIRGLPKDWRRPPGRPHHTWLRTLEADLQPLNLGLNSAHSGSRTLEAPRGNRYAPCLGACSWWWWWWYFKADEETSNPTQCTQQHSQCLTSALSSCLILITNDKVKR